MGCAPRERAKEKLKFFPKFPFIFQNDCAIIKELAGVTQW